MGLTSPALAVLTAAAAAALLWAVLWYWPRLSGKGARQVLLRLGAVCALQLSVLSFIFVMVNRSAEFYSSWSDLLGTDAGGGAITATHYSSARMASPVTVTASRAVAVPGRRRARGGHLQTVRIYGQLSGLDAPAHVYLPAGYSAAGYSAAGGSATRGSAPRGSAPRGSATGGAAGRLPVVVVISDQVSSHRAPYGAARLSATAAAQIAAGRLGPMILVMLPATVGQNDRGCLNIPGGAQAATFFSQDLPEAVTSAYRVGAQPSTWALLGDSSGGYCALQLAMTNSATFSAAAVAAGSYSSPPGPAESAGSAQIQDQDNLAWLLRHQPMQPVSVLFTGAGPAGPFTSLARPPMHVASAGLGNGPWPLSPVLDWIGRTLGGHS